MFGALLSGAVLTETIFFWPGIGRYSTFAISSLDYASIMGFTLLVAIIYVFSEPLRGYTVCVSRSAHQVRVTIMAAVETVTITPMKRKGKIGQWLENNESRINDLRYSVKLFFKSPLAVLGLVIVLLFIS